MLRLLFPPTIDNTFRGQRLGYWLLVPILFVKLGIALVSMVAPRQANSADAIDLSSYSDAALRDAATTTAALGLLHLWIGLICILAMVRYRALVPLLYLWLLSEFLARRIVLWLYPMDRTHGPSSGSIVNLVLLTAMVLGAGLSLWPRRDQTDRPSRAGVVADRSP